ncbi:hypothetical protein U9M48_014868 [Paspalum notatum var. saurae]|uniref:Uncharacterized protein n=1 Tax=Paspalum notatum var. saurae TaxID=547442 RepID=A0AAQ3T2Y9_PASNO
MWGLLYFECILKPNWLWLRMVLLRLRLHNCHDTDNVLGQNMTRCMIGQGASHVLYHQSGQKLQQQQQQQQRQSVVPPVSCQHAQLGLTLAIKICKVLN